MLEEILVEINKNYINKRIKELEEKINSNTIRPLEKWRYYMMLQRLKNRRVNDSKTSVRNTN